MIRRPTRRALLAAALAGSLAAVAGPAAAQTDAVPPVLRIVVPFAPGGSNDVIARAIAPLLGRRLGNSVVVENRPGAGGSVGADQVARAAKDGASLLLTSASLLTAAATQPRIPFDVTTAFAPVAMIGDGPMLVAVPGDAPYRTPADLVAAARAKPDAIAYGSAGIGSIGHLSTEVLADAAKLRMLHVPYKGASEALLGLGGDQIQLMITNYSSIVAALKSGKVKALAVTSARPSPAFPDLPPLAAAVPGYGIDIWVGVFAPAGTPPALVERYNRELNAIASSAELRMLLEPDGATPGALSPAAFSDRIRTDLATWKRIAAERGIKVE
ncbi:MAG: tripartite tricarboxylate transporter substrate-binding protein [Burkholderiales bacterium]